MDRMAVAAAATKDELDRHTGASAATAPDGPWLFRDNTGNNHGLIEWLRAREAQPRCNSLLKQVLEWSSHLDNQAMRALHAAQGITVPRKSRETTELLLEAVRKHFRQATSQEKGRLATFVFAKCPAELPVSPAADSEEHIPATDVIDLATLKAYR